MAKRRKSSGARTAGVRIVKVGAPRAAAPIIRVSAPRAAPVKHRRRRSVGTRARAFGGFVSQHNIDAFVGGGLFGYGVKQGWVDKLPAIPVIGRTGAAALVLDYFSNHGGGTWARKTAIAAAVLAGYQLGHDGKITGDSDVSGLVTTGDGFTTAEDLQRD